MTRRRASFVLLLATALWAALPLASAIAMRGYGNGDRAVTQFFTCFAPGAFFPDPGAHAGRPGPKNDRSACAFCQAFCSGHAPLPAQPGAVVATPVPNVSLERTVADRVAPTPRRPLSHRARAPPRSYV